MRYLVRARLKPGREADLLEAIEDGTLGAGSIAGGEYLRNMAEARRLGDGTVTWVEVCYCATPLAEERPYWEEYFELERIQDAHSRDRCRDESGEEPWACCDCDCTQRLERHLEGKGKPFQDELAERRRASPAAGRTGARRTASPSVAGDDGRPTGPDVHPDAAGGSG